MCRLHWTVIGKTGFGMLILLALLGCKPLLTAPAQIPTEYTYGFSQDVFITLNSLEKVDDYPLYVMHYVGEYDRSATANLPDNISFACSLFAALGDQENLLYGRNLDWAYSPALLLYTDPPDGYASVTMVNLTFSDFTPDSYRNLMEMTIPERAPLLETPQIPFDGMNEYGLTIGMAAVNESIADHDPFRPTIDSLGIMRVVLDHARTTDEAVAIFSKYNIDFTGGPPIHYLIADSRGQSVLIEYVDGQMVVLPNEYAWNLATNHLLSNGIKGGGSSGGRYDLLEERLAATGGILTPVAAMNLLGDVSQRFNGTQWSVVYDSSTGSIYIAMGRNYDAVYTFQLEIVDL